MLGWWAMQSLINRKWNLRGSFLAEGKHLQSVVFLLSFYTELLAPQTVWFVFSKEMNQPLTNSLAVTGVDSSARTLFFFFLNQVHWYRLLLAVGSLSQGRWIPLFKILFRASDRVTSWNTVQGHPLHKQEAALNLPKQMTSTLAPQQRNDELVEPGWVLT